MPMHHSAPQRATSATERHPPRAVRSAPNRHSIGALPAEHSAEREALEAYAMMRHSAPVLTRGSISVSTKSLPETVLVRTDVRVNGVSKRNDHCVYEIEVDTGFDIRVLYKRYSEIRDFRTQILDSLQQKKAHCGIGTCTHLQQLAQVKFPRRRLRLPGFLHEPSLDSARERIDLLERFMQAMLRVYRMATRRQLRACINSNCAMIGAIKDFLQVAEPILSPQDSTTSDEASEASAVHVELSGLGDAQSSNLAQGYILPNQIVYSGEKSNSLFSIAEDPEHLLMSN